MIRMTTFLFFLSVFLNNNIFSIIRIHNNCNAINLLNKKQGIFEKQNLIETKEYDVLNKALSLTYHIQDQLNQRSMFYLPEIEFEFTNVYDSFDFSNNIQPHHIRAFREKMLVLNSKVKKNLCNKKNFLNLFEIELLQNIQKLNDLFLTYFLKEPYISFYADELLLDYLFYLPKGFICKYSAITGTIWIVGFIFIAYYAYHFFFPNQTSKNPLNLFNKGDKGGLKNLGNTCYINSLLQALFASSEFVDEALKLKNDPNLKENKFFLELVSLIEERRSAKNAISPQKFVQQARKLFPQNSQKEQQDAAEFLRLILVKLPNLNEKFNLEVHINDQCKNCQEPKALKVEMLKQIECELGDNNNDLLGCLQDKAQETVYMRCNHCGGGNDKEFVRNIQLESKQNLLVFQLKRFNYGPIFDKNGKPVMLKDKKGNKRQKWDAIKNNTPMTFPTSSLKVNNIDQNTYDLISFVCHAGVANGGHYIAYAKDPNDNKWYKCNDSYRKEVSKDIVKKIAEADGNAGIYTPYLLFYEKSELH